MDLRIRGKVAIVTGGSQGIGKATAQALAEEGVHVALCARGIQLLQRTAKEIQQKSDSTILPIQADMTVADDIKQLVSTAAGALGGVDILVNNAVNSIPASFLELSDEEWLNHISVKTMGYVRCTREAVPHMIQRGGGRIINIGGMSTREVGRLRAANGVVTAGVANLTKNLSDQFGRHNILVNCIHPGTTRTVRQTDVLVRRARELGLSLEETERETVRSIPIGRLVEPEDIANLVLFLVSDCATAITGQVIAVDGGAGRGVFY
jgi:NAD(P)-dependent dehydrogenase (short-subunit alcohol dehydrogenase family)